MSGSCYCPRGTYKSVLPNHRVQLYVRSFTVPALFQEKIKYHRNTKLTLNLCATSRDEFNETFDRMIRVWLL